MVYYKCEKCSLEFNKKSNYIQHINKKFDCALKNNNLSIEESNNPILIQKNPKKSIFIKNPENFQISNQNCNLNSNTNKIENKENIEIKFNQNPDINNFCCGYCLKSYSTKSNLNKHLNGNCKIKKEKEEEKENIFKLLLAKDNEIIEQKKIINKILQQNELLIKKIDVLVKYKINKSPKNIYSHNMNPSITNTNNTINTTNTTNTINTNTNTNTLNNNIVMFNFGKEDLGIIDKQIYLERVIKKPISGVKIPEEILKIIHFNHQYPQLSNIYISDINREKCMIWEDGEWKLSPVDKIPEVIDKVVNYSNGIESELRQKFTNNKKVNDRLDIVNKYIQMNNNEYIEELKINENNDNTDTIKRCEGFQKLTYDTFKTTLYNEGKNIKKNIKN